MARKKAAEQDVEPVFTEDASSVVAEMTDAEKASLRQRVKDARSAVDDGYWALATELHVVYESGVFTEWGFEDWPSYVDGELDLQLRSTQYLIQIAEHFGKMDPEIQQWVKSLGWSKAKELVKHVTPENWTVWRDRVAGKTVREIVAFLKGGEEADGSEGGEEADGDQGGEKAKRVSFSLFPEQAAVVRQALDACMTAAETDKEGNALTLIAQDYLGQSGGTTLAERLDTLERTFGVKLVAFRAEDAGVAFLYGEENLDSLDEEIEGDDGSDEDE